jgi:hypothetical protein
MTEEQNKPTAVRFTDEEMVERSKKATLSIGYYRFLITDAKCKVSGANNMMVVCTCSPLKDPDDAGSASWPNIYHNLVLPFRNADVEDHTPPNTFRLVSDFLQATYDDKIPTMPRMQDGALVFKGEVISRDKEEAARLETNNAVQDLAFALWEDPSDLVDRAFYAEVFWNHTPKGDFLNLRLISDKKDPDMKLQDPKNFKA